MKNLIVLNLLVWTLVSNSAFATLSLSEVVLDAGNIPGQSPVKVHDVFYSYSNGSMERTVSGWFVKLVALNESAQKQVDDAVTKAQNNPGESYCLVGSCNVDNPEPPHSGGPNCTYKVTAFNEGACIHAM